MFSTCLVYYFYTYNYVQSIYCSSTIHGASVICFHFKTSICFDLCDSAFYIVFYCRVLCRFSLLFLVHTYTTAV